jgi:hypothetical protein
MQDPAATYIEAKLGQEAVLSCFALGTPTPITRSAHMIFILFSREYGSNREKYWSGFSLVRQIWVSGHSYNPEEPYYVPIIEYLKLI